MPLNITRPFWKIPDGPLVRTLGGSTSQDIGEGIVTDANNFYVTGRVVDAGTTFDMLIAKYDLDTTLQWQRRLGSSGTNHVEYGYSIDVDSSGNIYVGGQDRKTLTNVNENTWFDYDFLLAKYNSSGVLQWQKGLGRVSLLTGEGREQSPRKGLSIDSSGNVYMVGWGGDGSGGATRNTGLIGKWNNSGTLQWQRRFGEPNGGSNTDSFYSSAVDSSGNIYVSGNARSQGQGGSGGDSLIVKYNASGVLQWQRILGGTGNDRGQAIAVDSNANAYLVSETTSQGIQFTSVSIAKYNTSGVLQWQRNLSGLSTQQPFDAAVDDNDDLYITGYNQGAGINSIDMMVVKYNSSGVLQWQRALGHTVGSDYRTYGQGIDVDGDGNIYCTGYTEGAGKYDVIIVKWAPTPEIGVSGTFTSVATSLTDVAGTLTDIAGTISESAASVQQRGKSYTSSNATMTDTYIGP